MQKITSAAGNDVEKSESYNAGGNEKNSITVMENNLEVPQKVKQRITI